MRLKQLASAQRGPGERAGTAELQPQACLTPGGQSPTSLSLDLPSCEWVTNRAVPGEGRGNGTGRLARRLVRSEHATIIAIIVNTHHHCYHQLLLRSLSSDSVARCREQAAAACWAL